MARIKYYSFWSAAYSRCEQTRYVHVHVCSVYASHAHVHRHNQSWAHPGVSTHEYTAIDSHPCMARQMPNKLMQVNTVFRYTGCPKKTRNGGFSVPCILKVVYFLTSLDKASSAEENDTKIIKFGLVLFILRPFLRQLWVLPSKRNLNKSSQTLKRFKEKSMI